MNASNAWSEPTPERLAQAMDAYDRIAAGGSPRSPIENGMRIAHALSVENGAVPDKHERARSIAALARLADLDDEVPKARVNSLMAARMIMVDVSLQRDAAIASELDVLDNHAWWTVQEGRARGAPWLLATDLPRHMSMMGDESIDAIASGEFHFLPGIRGEMIKTSLEGLRASGNHIRRDVDLDILRVAGLIPAEAATALKASLVTREGRGAAHQTILSFHKATRRMDGRDWPDPQSSRREFAGETALINIRMKSNIRQERPQPYKIEPIHEAQAKTAIDESRLTNPDNQIARVVRAAKTVLADMGVDRSLMEGEAFKRTVTSSISRSTLHMNDGVDPDLMGGMLVGTTLIRQSALAISKEHDMHLPSGSEREAARAWTLKCHEACEDAGIHSTLTHSDRDRDDLKLIAEGRIERVSDRFGMRTAVIHATQGSSNDYKPTALVRNELKAMDQPLRMNAPTLSKGPRPPNGRTASEWIAEMAGSSRGDMTR